MTCVRHVSTPIKDYGTFHPESQERIVVSLIFTTGNVPAGHLFADKSAELAGKAAIRRVAVLDYQVLGGLGVRDAHCVDDVGR